MLTRLASSTSVKTPSNRFLSTITPSFIGKAYKTNVVSKESRRNLSWFSNMLNKNVNNAHKLNMDSLGGADAKLEYIRKARMFNPQQSIQMIESGWEAGTIPMTEPFAKEYCKAAFDLKRFDSVDLNALGMMLNASENGVIGNANEALSSQQIQQLMARAIINQGGSSSNSVGSGAGATPGNPIYVSPRPAGFKDQMWKLLTVSVSAFIVLAFVSTLFDPKAVASKMGMPSSSSTVKQAEHSDKSFADVVGIDEAKNELEEIVQYLKEPSKFTRLGGKLPKGVLLTGPPGTGKTLLARAIAGEAGVPFYYSSGSEFEEMYVGVGARRIRELFSAANSNAPCIIFIDEIDAVGGSRNLKDQTAMKMTLNQLLVEMDGFQENNGVIVIGATNFPDSLDQALVRPGRFDRHVDVPLPDVGGRKEILELYAKKMPLSTEVNLEQIARGTPGFSGAELFNLMNQAAVKSSMLGLHSISMGMLEWAKDKINMGSERQSAVISPETLKLTAHHEAGHALVGILTEGADPIHKATIIPRGRALGLVLQIPDGDQTSFSYKQMLARLDVCMGGRIAEEVMFGKDEVTSGASSDIQQATKLATSMVTKFGLTDAIGAVYINNDAAAQRDGSAASISDETQRKVDVEVKRLLDESYQRVTKLLKENKTKLQNVARGLIEYETLAGSEIVELINYKGELKDVHQIFTKGTTGRSQKPSRKLRDIQIDDKRKKFGSSLPPSEGNGSSGKKIPKGITQMNQGSPLLRQNPTDVPVKALSDTPVDNSPFNALSSWFYKTTDQKAEKQVEHGKSIVVDPQAPQKKESIIKVIKSPSQVSETTSVKNGKEGKDTTTTRIVMGSNGMKKTSTTVVNTKVLPDGTSAITSTTTDIVTNAEGATVSKSTSTSTRRTRGPPAAARSTPVTKVLNETTIPSPKETATKNKPTTQEEVESQEKEVKEEPKP